MLASGYPGVGAALAWDTAVVIEPEAPLHPGYRLVIADGAQEPEHLAAAAHGVG